MTSAVLPDVEVLEGSDSEGPESFAHILLPEYTPAMLLQARLEGTPVEAWCGHRWIPFRDPSKLPLCQRCKDIHASFDRRPLGYA